MNEDGWIDTEKELPPCDGYYQATNKIGSDFVAIMKYDGIGFLYQHAYRPVKYWMPYHFKEKRYGKITQ